LSWGHGGFDDRGKLKKKRSTFGVKKKKKKKKTEIMN